MPKEIIKEQLSPEAKDSMGNPAGQSHKRIHVPDGSGNHSQALPLRLKTD